MNSQALIVGSEKKPLVLRPEELEKDIEPRLRRLGRLVKDLAGPRTRSW